MSDERILEIAIRAIGMATQGEAMEDVVVEFADGTSWPQVTVVSTEPGPRLHKHLAPLPKWMVILNREGIRVSYSKQRPPTA